MNAFSIGVTALGAGRRAIDLIGQNIANASTPGYSRQSINLVTLVQGNVQGSGVGVAGFTRYSDPPVRSAILAGNGVSSALGSRLNVRQQVETYLGTGGQSIAGRGEEFFNRLERLSTRPDDPSVRRPALAAAADLAAGFNAASADIDRLRQDIGLQAYSAVTQVNDYTQRIAALNIRISGIESVGDQANELRDQRDQLVTELSQIIDVRVIEQPFGVVNVQSSGALLVAGEYANTFTLNPTANGSLVLRQANSTNPIRVDGGKLGGLLQEHNVDLPATAARMDTLAREFVRRVNTINAAGIGIGGPQTVANGTVSVADPTAPLATQNLPFPIVAGDLVISVTDTATGTRTNSTVSIDPATQSLNDVAAAITAATGGQVTASVDPTNNTLRFEAAAGQAFDFAGRVPNPPAGPGTGGTSAPQIGGIYTGTANDNYTFSVSGAGTVGTTPGLTVTVRDQANNVIATLNVGAGYAPGTPLVVGNGVTVALAAGTVSNGSFSAPMIAYPPDSAGLLAGTGVNGLFEGDTAAGIRVRPEVQADVGLMALSRTGTRADGSNLQQLINLRDVPGFAGNRTFTGEATDLATTVGTEVRSLDDRRAAQDSSIRNLTAQEQGVTGVDVNEEFVKLLDFQRMVDGASRYISIANEAMDSLLRILD